MNENGIENLCGYIKDNDEPCELTAGWGTDHVGEGRCRYHPGRGAPEGNDNAIGNAGDDQDGNFKALKTGEHTPAERWEEFLEEHAPERFKDFYYGYQAHLREQGANPVEAARIARLWARADYNDTELIKNGFETEQYNDEGVYVGDAFDSDRDSSVIKSERAARLLRREEELTPHSQSESQTDVTVEGGGFSVNISHQRVTEDDPDDEHDS
jgi:hypothetical protein